ncbi:MAG TPA: MlaA family lipoprotein, partial [Victivallales bacterium]|nr:MlaA family lipoprotein [Victivallales bacterium]
CEARLGDSGIEAGRFAINLPFLLFYDGANNFFHLPPRNADMGQAFATWGCGPGFYVMLPLLGPSNVRDGIGMGIDHMLDFRTIISWASWGIGYAASVDADAIVDSTPSTFAEAIGNVGGAGMAAEVEGVANTVSYAAEGSSMLDPVSAFSLHAGDLSVMTAAFEDPYYMVKNYWYLYRQIQVADY